MMIRSLIAATVVLVVAAPALADRGAHARARAAFATAEAAYKAKDYAAAATAYEAAYAAEADPAYLFDTAQALRLALDCAGAGRYYRKFLVEVSAPPNLAKVQRLLAEVDACTPVAENVSPPIVAQPPDSPVVVPPPPQPLAAPLGHPHRTAAITLLATGLVLLGGGAYFTDRVSYWSDQREQLCSDGACTWTAALTQRAQSDDSSGRLDSHLAVGAFAIGAVALAAGVYFYQYTTRELPVEVSLVPGGASLSAHVRF